MSDSGFTIHPNRSLKSLLLWWIVGAGSIFAIIFALISALFLNLGVILKMKGESEREITEYMSRYEIDPSTPLPQDDFYRVYSSIDDIPAPVKKIFKPETYTHEGFDFFVDIDYDDSEITPVDDFKDLCEGQVCQILFFYSYRMPEGQWLYLLSGLQLTEAEDKERDTVQDAALFVAVFAIFLFSMLALLLFRRISQPVKSLAEWADQLTIDKLRSQHPEFRFKELNAVAEKLNEAFKRTAESVEKEHRFLQYASHELRTPIAVASGNLELLDKLSESNRLPEEERAAIDRIRYSVKDMRLLTETLLWLNRSDSIIPPKEPVDLRALCQNSIQDNEYLLKGKQVSVELTGEPCIKEVSPVFCSILISNLIRNAFQHTQEGGVHIDVDTHELNILNWELGTVSPKGVADSEQAGFGLGLDLVEQIAGRMGWQYECEITKKGRLCRLVY
ncbi:sensor histidine kinase [Pseudoteredinibacter isoporae]|uniref:histidine kinase n=1 Tax=Pseudoteredinibacter isoporae TaxID=570281 RepID=A0A7X0MWN6_9GAMM|nr:HAMP domain-containing sensor histidine kinase [Pseudoteredinibacter isoporae]MBB6522663.1 signal transduction histidine kinase [Pseudoteredinibacter isoporae]NHO88194.1 HAMP domain-containing histidine kinase [Pseudoteredinibacter isoporae]NIB23475.1 HAMP domain-containing histidine kinase [Pseudoteredinibacter isoporae]